MGGAPKKSVTRFFVPLIDVLLLLFCIFLLMPFVDKEAATDSKLTPGLLLQLRQRIAALEAENAELKETRESDPELKNQIEALKAELGRNAGDKLFVRTFQIDNRGNLTYLELRDGKRTSVPVDEKEFDEVFSRDKGIQITNPGQELLYLVMYPRENTLAPDREQKQLYQSWFAKTQGDKRVRVTVRWEVPDRG